MSPKWSVCFFSDRGERDSIFESIVKRWPIFALVFFAWVMLSFVIPFIAALLIGLTNNSLILELLIKYFTPLLLFLLFLYVWYKLTETYYVNKAKKMGGG